MAGDFIYNHRDDERVGRLASAFDRMSERVADSIQQHQQEREKLNLRPSQRRGVNIIH